MDRLKIYKSLANKDRLRIIDLLKKSGQLNVGEINKKLKITRSLLTYHLKVLRDVNIIKLKKHGQFRFYSLNKGNEYI